MNTEPATRELAVPPCIGEIYRDETNQSFVVLTLDQKCALVEFADGRIKRIDRDLWETMCPKPAAF